MKQNSNNFLRLSKRIIASSALAMSILAFNLSSATASAASQVCAAKDTSCVIQFGDQQITSRLTALQKLGTTVTDDQTKHVIDDDHANSIQQDIQTNVNGLNTLKAKLDVETDTKAARQDVAAIYTQFRIYAVVLPRDTRRLHLAIEITVDNKLTALKASLEEAIDKADAGDKAKLNALYSDYKNQLADAESNIDQAQTTWPLLTVDSYNTDRSAYNTNKRNLTSSVKKAHDDLHQAAQDLHQIRQSLKN